MSCNPINPATGLPMTDYSYGGVDVGGNPYCYSNPWSSSSWEKVSEFRFKNGVGVPIRTCNPFM